MENGEESEEVRVMERELDKVKAEVDHEKFDIKAEGGSCNEKKKKRGKERLYAEYKGFEKVVENQEAAGKGGQGAEICDQSGVDHEEFKQVGKMDKVKVTKKKKKRGTEKFDKEFARNGHLVSSLMKKVERNNNKMEKLGRKKDGFTPIVAGGEQWFDAPSDLPKAGERELGVESMQGGCSRVEVKRAEVM